VLEEIRRCFDLGRNRTGRQDPEFGAVQIVDIALKALSPGINDPTTAVTCLDYLTGILRHLGGRTIPSRFRSGPDGRTRMIARRTDFGRMADLCFRQIRRYGAADATVCLALLQCIERVAHVVTDGEWRQVLREQAERAASSAERELQDESDRAEVRARAGEVLASLSGPPRAEAAVGTTA